MELYRTEIYKQLQLLNLLDVIAVGERDERARGHESLRSVRLRLILGECRRKRISESLAKPGVLSTATATVRLLLSGGRRERARGSLRRCRLSIACLAPARFITVRLIVHRTYPGFRFVRACVTVRFPRIRTHVDHHTLLSILVTSIA